MLYKLPGIPLSCHRRLLLTCPSSLCRWSLPFGLASAYLRIKKQEVHYPDLTTHSWSFIKMNQELKSNLVMVDFQSSVASSYLTWLSRSCWALSCLWASCTWPSMVNLAHSWAQCTLRMAMLRLPGQSWLQTVRRTNQTLKAFTIGCRCSTTLWRTWRWWPASSLWSPGWTSAGLWSWSWAGPEKAPGPSGGKLTQW